MSLRNSILPLTWFEYDHWHAYLDDPTLADAILDRVIHASHRIELAGESMRKQTKAQGKPK